MSLIKKNLKIALSLNVVLEYASCLLKQLEREKKYNTLTYEDEVKHVNNLVSEEWFHSIIGTTEATKSFVETLSKSYKIVIPANCNPKCWSSIQDNLKGKFPLVNIICSEDLTNVNCDVFVSKNLKELKGSVAKEKILLTDNFSLANSFKTDIPSIAHYFSFTDGSIHGIKIAKDYTEIIQIIEKTAETSSYIVSQPPVVCLVGPSGSGKTITAEALVAHNVCKKVITTTTRDPRPGEQNGVHYHFVKDIDKSQLLEYTDYCGSIYGTTASAIDSILSTGKPAVIVMDINGAKALKSAGYNVIDIFMDRPLEDLIATLKERNASPEENERRINKLKEDKNNKKECSWYIDTGSPEERVNAIISLL